MLVCFERRTALRTTHSAHQLYEGRSTGRHGPSQASIYPYSRYACRDGDIVLAVQHQGEWARFCDGVLGRPNLMHDARFADNARRVGNRTALDAMISLVFADLSQAEAISRRAARSIALARVSAVTDLPNHPALRHIEDFLANGSSCQVPRPAGRAFLAPGQVPGLGEHTQFIRREFSAEPDG